MEVKKIIDKYELENKNILKRRPDLHVNGDFTFDGIKLFCNNGFIKDLKQLEQPPIQSEGEDRRKDNSREEIRMKFFTESNGGYWINGREEVDIDYVYWLEDMLGKQSDVVEEEKYTKFQMKQFVEFLLAEGIVIQDENSSSNLDFLHDVWSGKNPDGLL